MKVYGSLINRIGENQTGVKPEIGMGATITAYSDRYAGTVTHLTKDGRDYILTVREDHATRIDNNGMSESQEYIYQENLHGRIFTFKKNKKGVWRECKYNRETSRWNIDKDDGCGLILGERDAYYDFDF